MRISVLAACLVSVVLTTAACAQNPPAPPAPPEAPAAPLPPEPPQPPASVGAPNEREFEAKIAEVPERMADEQKRMADAQRRMADSQRKVAVDAGRLNLTFRGSPSPQPVLIGTESMSSDTEAELREDLRVMDKLLNDQLSSAAISTSPWAMGIKLSSLGQSEPMYIEGLGCVFTCRSGIPLAEGKRSTTTKRAAQPPPSAWDKAKREITGQGRTEYADFQLKLKEPRMDFDQAALNRLIESILKTLPEATNLRNLTADHYVIVTVVGTDDDGTPMRLTMKAKKGVIDGMAKGSFSAEAFSDRVARRIH